MNKLFAWGALASLLILTSCGKQNNSSEEAACNGCTEQSINAPVGPQPAPEKVVPYDLGPGNPSRDSLRFPDFKASWGLKRAIYDKAVAYFEKNKGSIPNPRYFTVVDFNLNASKKRLFLFDLSDASVEMHNAAAGKKSDPDGDGFATDFSNDEGSQKSSLGFYQTLQTYIGEHGLSLRLSGLDDTNNNAEARAIVMHPANYVSDAGGRAGRSWGCPAIDPTVSKSIIDRVQNGSMLLIDK